MADSRTLPLVLPVLAALGMHGCGDPVASGGDVQWVAAIEWLQAPTEGVTGENLTIRFRLVDASGGGLADRTPVAEVVLGGGTVDPARPTTGPEGQATFTWTLGSTPGPQRLHLVADTVSADLELIAVLPPPKISLLKLTMPATATGRLGSVVPVNVMAEDQYGAAFDLPADTRIEVVSTSPFFPGSEVVRATGQAPDLGLELVWPGRATIRAAALTIRSAPIGIEVAPAEPVVGQLAPSRVAPGDTGTLSGYRLDLLDPAALQADGRQLDVVSQDAATLRFRVPDLGVSAIGCDPASSIPLTLDGVRVFGKTPVLRYGTGQPVELAVGEYVMLGTAGSGCLEFPDDIGTESKYTLVFMDGRPIRESETGPEGASTNWTFAYLRLMVTDRTVDAPSVTTIDARTPRPAVGGEIANVLQPRDTIMAPPRLSAAINAAVAGGRADVTADLPPTDYLGYFARPLELGETVSVDADSAFTYEAARVLKRYGASGEVVLLGLEAEGATADRVGTSFRVDAAMQALAEQLPFLSRALSDNFPDHYQTGQVIFLIRAYRGGFPGVAIASTGERPGGTPYGYILFQMTQTADWATGGPEYNLYALAHETAHLAQISRDQDLCDLDPETSCPFWGTAGTWAVEGGADFLANESVRRAAGLSFQGNTFPAARIHAGAGGAWRVAGPPAYPFGRGYGYAEWFMRDLLQRVVSTGMNYDDAVALVGRATYEPWYGWVSFLYWDPVERMVRTSPPHQPVPGLVARIRQALGPTWDPIPAFLVGAASQAVDDLTSNPELQNVTHGLAWELFDGPFAEITLGTGQSVDHTTNAWSFGWAHITAPTGGGELSFGSPAPDIYWMLIRTH